MRVLYVVGLLTAFDLGQLISRIAGGPRFLGDRPDLLRWFDWLGVVGSFVLFHLGVGLLAMGLLLLCRSRPRIAIRLIQLLASAIAIAETISHGFYMMTGSLLDAEQLEFALRRPRELWLVTRAAPSIHSWGVLLGPLLVLFFLLEAVWPFQPPASERAPSRMKGMAALLAAGVAFACAYSPQFAGSRLDRNLVRDPAFRLIFTIVNGWRRDRGAVGLDQAQATHEFERTIAQQPGVPRRNLVLVVLESTRFKSTTLHQPSLPTTPFLAELSHKSLVVNRAYAVFSRTPKALVAILCGWDPAHTVEVKSAMLGLLYWCMPALLADQGYQTAFFQTVDFSVDDRATTSYEMGFHELISPLAEDTRGFEQANAYGFEDESLIGPARRWLAKHGSAPFFLTFMTINPHVSCQPLRRHGFLSLEKDPELNCYENAVRADDFFLRSLVQTVEQSGHLDDTIFVVVGDHGEAFGEHGLRWHGNVPYEEGLRVPMLIYDPTGTRVPPSVVAEPRNQLDLMPTLLQVLGFKLTKGAMPGTSLLAPVKDRPLMASCIAEDTCLVRILGDEKYIDYFSYRRPELYDLARDPGELNNLAPDQPEEVAQAHDEVMAWHQSVLQRFASRKHKR